VAINALGFLPQPNRPPNNPFNQTGNWQENRVNVQTRDYYVGRLDHE
jgi:hypothetical protein